MGSTGSATRAEDAAAVASGAGAEGSGRELDLVVAAAALLVLVAYAPGLDQAPTTLRFLAVAPIGAAGLVVLVRLGLAADRAARWALGYLAWSLVAALASDNVRQSIIPGFGTDRGWLALAAFIGWYAVGRRRGESGQRLLVGALLAGLLLNALLAIAQSLIDGQDLLATSDGRALGFAPSPVYLGTLLAGAVPFAAWFAANRRQQWGLWLVPLALFGAATNASGSRSGFLAGLAVSVWVIRRSGWRRAGAIVGTILIGALLVQPLLHADSASGRIGDGGGGGVGTRLAMWDVAVEKSMERPVLGWGPNRFLDVATPEITADFARSEGPEKVFFDAHNIVLENLLSSGLPGVVLLVGFAISAGRRAAGPLACFAAGAAITWLVEPASISTAPLVLLSLGVASTALPPPVAPRPWRGVALGSTLLLVALATFGAGRLLLADLHVEAAVSGSSPDDIAAARRLVPDDPVLSDTQTQILLQLVGFDADRWGGPAIRSAERTIELEPDRALWWYRLAQVNYAAAPGSDQDRARATKEALLRAHQLNPWSADILDALVTTSTDLGQDAAAARWQAQLCQITACEPS